MTEHQISVSSASQDLETGLQSDRDEGRIDSHDLKRLGGTVRID